MTPERYQRLINVLSKRQPSLTVLLENVADPHNISAVMRTCDAVGIQDIYILNTAIPKHKKWGSKSSSSASKWLSVHQFTSTQDCVNEIKTKYHKIFSTHLSAASIELYDMDLTIPVALAFGNEHSGVSEELNALADGNFIIPQVGIIKSLNISVACAVTLYEAFRQKQKAGHYDKQQMDSARFESLKQQWGATEGED